MADADDRRRQRSAQVSAQAHRDGHGDRQARRRARPALAHLVTLALVVVAVLVPVAAVGLNLATNAGRLGGRAEDEPPAAEVAPAIPAPAAPAQAAGPPSNLLANWSFEHDLSGWLTVGDVDLTREPAGRTSGSAARVRVPGARQAGIAVARAAVKAPGGGRYAASAWVHGGKGVLVKLCVFSIRDGRRSETERALRLRGAGDWDRLKVTHRVPAGGGDVGLEVLTARGEVVVDEVTLTRR